MYRPLALRCRALLVGLLLGTLVLLPSCQSSRQAKTYTRLTGEVFHTYFSIQYDLEEDYQREVDSTFHVFSQSLNPFDSTSLITAINRNRSTHTDTMLREVFLQAMEISRHSQGSYDVTCAPLINLWGFGFEKVDSVSPRAIDSILSFVGYQRVRLEGEEMIKEDPRMKMDVLLDLQGLLLRPRRAYARLSWSTQLPRRARGRDRLLWGQSLGRAWIIGIDKPIDDPSGQVNDLQLRLQLPREAGGLATSGNYRNYRVVNGVKLAHTIDPRTGYPLQTDVLSATILAPTCMLADGLATACMTRQSSEVPALLAHFPGVEYMLILGDGHSGFRTVMSPGFKRLVLPDK